MEDLGPLATMPAIKVTMGDQSTKADLELTDDYGMAVFTNSCYQHRWKSRPGIINDRGVVALL